MKLQQVLKLKVTKSQRDIVWKCYALQFHERREVTFGQEEEIPLKAEPGFLELCILALQTKIADTTTGRKLPSFSDNVRAYIKTLHASSSVEWHALVFGNPLFSNYLIRKGNVQRGTHTLSFPEFIKIELHDNKDHKIEEIDILEKILYDFKKRRTLIGRQSKNQTNKAPKISLLRISKANGKIIDSLNTGGGLVKDEFFRLEFLSDTQPNLCLFWIGSNERDGNTLFEIFPTLEVPIRLDSDKEEPEENSVFVEDELYGLRIPSDYRLRVGSDLGYQSLIVIRRSRILTDSELTRIRKKSMKASNIVVFISQFIELDATYFP